MVKYIKILFLSLLVIMIVGCDVNDGQLANDASAEDVQIEDSLGDLDDLDQMDKELDSMNLDDIDDSYLE